MIHIEGLWAENELTVEGTHLHERADKPDVEHRQGVRIARGVPLQSLRFGLSGRADVVEFHDDGAVVPVEYKRGRPKRGDMDRVQVCAQALCLEEMLNVEILRGALFYARTRRREEVLLDPQLRGVTEDATQRLHALIGSGVTPSAVREPKCTRCSLLHICLPDAMSQGRRARDYFETSLTQSLSGGQSDAESAT